MADTDTHRKIRVLLVGPLPPPYGGIPTYVKSLYDAKIENIDYMLFNTASPPWVEPLSREGKRDYTSIFEFGFFASMKKILYIFGTFIWFTRLVVVNKPDIIQVFTCSYWGYWRNWVYVLIAKFLNKITIFHLLGAIDLFYDEVGRTQQFLLRKSLNSADCYLMQSPGLETWARKYSEKMVVGIWNGINFDQIPQKSELPPDIITDITHPIGLTIGNLSTNKGTLEIIKALSKIQNHNINVSWIFVGNGDIEKYTTLAREYGLSSNIYFTGPVSEYEKWQILQNASFFCLPSYAEGQPISIIEAMVCGLPVISTKVGSIPEMVVDGLNGKLINAGDTDALENAIISLIQQPETVKTMGKASYELCQERHNIKDLYDGLSTIYIKLKNNPVEKTFATND